MRACGERKKAEKYCTDQQTDFRRVIWRGSLDRSTGHPFYQISRRIVSIDRGAWRITVMVSQASVRVVVGGFFRLFP